MDAAALVEAGGLVPPDAALPPDVVTDTVDARGYRHPGIPDRLVVRLVPDAIADGVDTEMSLLGFSLGVHHDDLARQRHRTLGFPGWALVNDPKRARQALEVMKEFRVEAKRASSKPGHAKEGFQAIADRLARSVPHFLPSFWEQAGRAFVDAGNPKMAATMFDKARAAEREFGLEIDEQVRADAFLEFALAGAITVKSLQGWAKELAASEGPQKAYDRFYALAVRRTLGGLPPWAGIAKDLRGLAKAAKRDVAAEDERFVVDVLTAPSLDRAPASFWEDYGDALVRAAKRDPAVAKRWLERFPAGGASRWSGVEEEFALAWLDRLEEAGVLRTLWEGPPLVDRGGWLARAIDWAPQGLGALLQLARAMAPSILAEGKPLALGDEDGWARLEVSLLDLLVELGVPFAGASGLWLDLGSWGDAEPVPERWGLPAEARPRDPVHLALHPELGERLVSAVGDQMGEASFEAASRTSKALAEARRSWLAGQIERVASRGVPTARAAIEVLTEKTTASTFAPWPEQRRALEQADVARALAATLQVGLADELGWPAWDEACDELGREQITVGGPLPFTVLASPRRAVVLGPDGRRVTAIDLKLKKDEEVQAVAWIEGHLLLVYRNDDWETRGRWLPGSGEPFEAEVPYWEDVVRIGIPAPGGGVSCGGPPVRPGDARWPEATYTFTDGKTAWILKDNEVHRLDPETGGAVTVERPEWLRGVEALWLDDCHLHPAPASSPLGTKDGLYGWRIAGEDNVREAIDGRRFAGQVNDDEAPQALVTFPGDPRPRPVYRERWGDEGVYVGSPDGWLAAVQPEARAVPLSRWHWLVPRDPAASALLRSFPSDRARALIDAVRDREDAADAVAPLLPEVRDAVLRTAIAEVAQQAADAEGRLRDLLADRPEDADGPVSAVTAEHVREALGVLMGRGWGDEPFGDSIKSSFRFLRTGEGGTRVRWIDHDQLVWTTWYGTIRALGWAAARVGAEPKHRSTVADLLKLWVEAGGCEPMHLRRATWSFDRIDAPFLKTKVDDGEKCLQDHWTASGDGWRALAWTEDTWSNEGPFTVETFEWSESGTFPELAGATRASEQRWSTPGADAAWIGKMVDAIGRHGERVPTDEDVATLAERTGLGRGAAVLVLAGAPNMGQWNKDFLGKELRATLGLKVAEAAAGKDAISSLDAEDWLAVLSAAMPAEPDELWGPPAASRLAEAWLARFGTRVAVPDEVRMAADKELPAADALDLLAAPDADARLRTDAVEIDAGGDVSVKGEGAAFDEDLARQLSTLLPWAAGALPVGDPLRSNVPRVIRTVRARLANPAFAVAAGQWWPENQRKVKTLLDAVGGSLTVDGDGEEKIERRDTGAVVVVSSDGSLNLAIRPARMDEAGWALVAMFHGGLGEPDWGDGSGPVRVLASPGFLALAERIESTPVPAGGWEQDPLASVPALVAEVARAKRLSEDAARLYLQLLALHRPTKKNVLLWNGWTPKVHEAAAAALVDAKLALEAKRQRAGRDHFLPGPWLDRKGVDLPLERWKVPLYGGTDEKGTVRFPLEAIVPLEPFHTLFAKAWDRVSTGDAPRFA